MKKAFRKSGLKSIASTLEENAYYVKFTPADAKEGALLDEDTTLNTYEYPLEQLYFADSTFNNNSDISEYLTSAKYAVVKSEDLINQYNYEIIEPLYLPEEKDSLVEKIALAQAGLIEIPEGKDTIQYLDKSWFGYYPSVRVMVFNTRTNAFEPVVDAKVRVIWSVYATKSDGWFKATIKSYIPVNTEIWFQSAMVDIRRYAGELLGISRFQHLYRVSKSDNNKTRNINNQENREMWDKATIFRAVQRYNAFAWLNNIKQTENIKLWIFDNNKGSSAPCFKRFGGVTYVLLDDWMRVIVGVTLAPPLIYQLLSSSALWPDIIIDPNPDTQSLELTVFHELSHYSHANNWGRAHWNEVARGEFNNTRDLGDPYHNGTNPTNYQAAHIALAESWATFMENRIGAYYGYGTSVEGFRPYTIPFIEDDGIDVEGWIPSGIYWDIIDNTPNEVIRLRDNNDIVIGNPFTDNLNGSAQGITINIMYNIVCDPNINSIGSFRTSLINQYPALNQQITNLFTAYGY